MHVSEVASRWIKNIHEFLSEEQRLVVKVLHVDKEKNQIDVSLRRVCEEEKRNKQESVKRAARAQKLLQFALQKSKSPFKFGELCLKLEDVYGEAYAALEEVLENDDALANVQIPEALKKEIIEVVRKSIKKAKVCVSAELMLKCFASEGLEQIKHALSISEPDTVIYYSGAPHYKLNVFAPDYKTANKKMENTIAKIRSRIKKDCVFDYKVLE